MRNRLLATAASAALLATFAGGAQAGDPGPFVSAFGGVILPIHADAWAHLGTACDAAFPPVGCDPFTIITSVGFRAGGSVGFYVDPSIGLEGEVSFAKVNLVGAEIPPGSAAADISAAGATANLLSLMANVMVGGQMGPAHSYVAVGGGAVGVSLDVPALTLGPDEAVGTDWTWGAQLLAGVDIEVADGVSVGGRYRLQRVGPSHFVDGGGDPANDSIHIGGFNTHGFELVVRVGL